jgi:hypothetical protein
MFPCHADKETLLVTLEQQRRATWLGLIALGVIAGLVIGLQHAGVQLPRWSRLALLAVVVPIACYTTLRWWKLLDEVAREAHKFAWYWGGSGGTLASGLAMGLVARDSIPIHFAIGHDPSDIYAAGVLTVLAAQVVGYTIAWAGWWWARR